MPEDTPLSDAERDLLNRRRDLEREYDAKLKDLKAQHKRQADKLQADREEWEAYKRQQQKTLADQAERLKRKSDNTQKAEQAQAATADEVAALRARVQELEQEKLKARTTREALEERLVRAETRLKSYRPLLFTVCTASLVATGAWVVIALQSAPAAMPWAVAGLAGAVLVNLWRMRVVRARPTRT